jgi:hypothetical protein
VYDITDEFAELVPPKFAKLVADAAAASRDRGTRHLTAALLPGSALVAGRPSQRPWGSSIIAGVTLVYLLPHGEKQRLPSEGPQKSQFCTHRGRGW